VKIVLSALVIAVIVAAGWIFRYAYLPPVVFQDTGTRENPHGRFIVVCKVNRWTTYVACESVTMDIDRHVEEVKRWAEEYRKK